VLNWNKKEKGKQKISGGGRSSDQT